MPLISHKKDPAGIEKPTFYEVADNTNILEWLSETFESDDDLCSGLSCSFVLNEKEIFRSDHKNANESILDITMSNNDHLIIINRPAGLGAFVIAQIVVAVVSVAISIYTYLNMPELGDSETASESPNSKLSAGSNSFRPYQGIPEILGEGVAYPDFVQNSYYYYENNIKKVIDLLCETVGEAEQNAVNIGTTNIESISESTATFFEPGDNVPQEYLTIHSKSTEVDGQTCLAPNDESVLKENQRVTVTGNGSTTIVSIDDSDYDETTFINDTGLDVGDYLYIRSQYISEFVPGGDPILKTLLNGVFKILSITSTSNPATFIIDDSRTDTTPLSSDAKSSVGRGFSEGVIGEGTKGEVDNYVGWFELAGNEAEEVWFNWTMPYGLRNKKGKAATMAVRFDIQAVVDGNLTGEIWSKTESITKNTPDGQYRTLRFTKENTVGMPTARFAVRIKRLTNVLDNDGGALEKVQIESVESVTPYFNQDFGNVTMLLVERKATLYSADQAGKKINVEYIRKLPSYNRETGFYDVDNLVATKSFADAAAYTLIVAGNETIDTVDLAELYAIYDGLSDPCLGEFSYTFDDADLSMGERVDNICKAARVISFHDGIKWRFSRDEIKPFRTALLNRRSTVGNAAQQSWQPQRGDDSDSVRIIYVDSDTNTEAYVDRSFNTSTGEIINDEIGFNLKEINLAGCRNITQATNRADLEIRRLAYQRRSVTETTRRDALTIDLLDRVGWCDPNDVDTFDGEIMGINGDVYDTTERFESIDGENYVVFVTDDEGYPSNTVVCTPRDDTEFGFIATGISSAYVATGVQQVGSRYFIANATDLGSSNFTLTSRTPEDDGTVTVELAEYRVEMYEKDNQVQAKEAPQIPAGLSALDFKPSGLISTSTLTFKNNGVIDLNGVPTLWYKGGVVASIGEFFEIKAAIVTGSASGVFDQWVALTNDLAWSITESIDNSVESAIINFKVRQIDYTSSIADNDITISATIGKNVELPDLIEVTEIGVSQVISSINLNSDGSYSASDGGVGAYTTISPNIGEFYEIKATSTMQEDFPLAEFTVMGILDDYVDGGLFDTWTSLKAAGFGQLLSVNVSDTASFYITIRRVDDVLDADTCIVTLNSFID